MHDILEIMPELSDAAEFCISLLRNSSVFRMKRAALVTMFKEKGPKTAVGIQNLFSDGLFTMTKLKAYAANKERGAVNAAASPDEGDSASDSEN